MSVLSQGIIAETNIQLEILMNVKSRNRLLIKDRKREREWGESILIPITCKNDRSSEVLKKM
jgi:hypothetical protein